METNVVHNPSTKGRRTNWFASFSGLIPLFLVIPFLILQLWVVYIALAVGGSIVLSAWNLAKTRTVASLDILTLLFGLANAVLYFGFHNLFLFTRLGCVIYTLLLLQVLYSLVKGQPWTEQYAKRSVSPEVQQNPLFRKTNLFLTIVWGMGFFACDVISLVGSGLFSTLVPLALVVLIAVGTPTLARLYARTHAPA